MSTAMRFLRRVWFFFGLVGRPWEWRDGLVDARFAWSIACLMYPSPAERARYIAEVRRAMNMSFEEAAREAVERGAEITVIRHVGTDGHV